MFSSEIVEGLRVEIKSRSKIDLYYSESMSPNSLITIGGTPMLSLYINQNNSSITLPNPHIRKSSRNATINISCTVYNFLRSILWSGKSSKRSKKLSVSMKIQFVFIYFLTYFATIWPHFLMRLPGLYLC